MFRQRLCVLIERFAVVVLGALHLQESEKVSQAHDEVRRMCDNESLREGRKIAASTIVHRQILDISIYLDTSAHLLA